MSSPRVAALYVDPERGPYPALGVDAWGIERDATRYEGPFPVVAHPPCGPWSTLKAFCGPALLAQKWIAPHAVEQVRTWGGVLEHPRSSGLWGAVDLPPPGGLPDRFGGFTLEIDQARWGHKARKLTWFYFVGIAFDELPPIPLRGSGRTPSPRRGDAGPIGSRASTPRKRT